MRIATLSVRHSAVLSMILIALAAFGIFSISTTNLEFIPDMDMPQIFVVAVYPGASAEDVENDVVDILEDDFVTLPGFKSMDSQSMNSAAMITITFQDGIDPEDQLNEVRNRISQLMDELPDGLSGEPAALIGGATMLPIVSFSVESSGDVAALSEYIDDTLRPQLTRIPGVSTITISGGVEPEVSVRLRMDDLNARGISPLTVYQILSYSNISMPLDTAVADGRRIDLRFDGRFGSISEIGSLPVGATDSGEIIRLSDVADISLEYQGEDYYVTSGGKDIIVVETAYAYTLENLDGVENTFTANEEKVSGYPATPEGQAAYLRDTMEATSQVDRGIGVFYWEPAWKSAPGITWSTKAGMDYTNDHWKEGNSRENQALFDDNGQLLPSVKVFND